MCVPVIHSHCACVDEDDSIWAQASSSSTSFVSTPPSRNSAYRCRESNGKATDIFLKPSMSNELHLRQAGRDSTNRVHKPSFNAVPSPPTIQLMRLPFSCNIHKRVVSRGKRSKNQSQPPQGEEKLGSNLVTHGMSAKKRRIEPTGASSSFFSEFPFSPLVTKTRNFQKLDSAAKVQRLCKATTVTHKTVSLHSHPCSSSTSSTSLTSRRDPELRQMKLTTVMKQPRSLPPTQAITHVFPSVKENIVPEFQIPPTPSVILGNTMRRNVKGETPLHIAAIKVSINLEKQRY